jgi:hypothetical protein
MRPLPALLPATALAAALLAPSRADAYERQWHAGASFGYAAVLGSPALHGFGGGVHLTYGITDAFNLMGEFDVTYHPSGKALIAGGGVGAGYVVDILQWVPYVGALVGAVDVANLDPACGTSTAAACNAPRLNLALPFGLDYQFTRSFALGVMGRFQVLLLSGSPATMMGAFAKAEYIWGF